MSREDTGDKAATLPLVLTVTLVDLVDGRYAEARLVRDGSPLAVQAPVAVTLTCEAVFGPA